MKQLVTLFLLLFSLVLSIQAQQAGDLIFSGCGTDLLHRAHPELAPRQNAQDESIYQELQGLKKGAKHFQGQRNLPIVVHIIHNDGPENISDAQVQQGIAHLNAAFAGNGGASTVTDIQFCLAQRTPDGLATNGITRDKSTLTSFDMDQEDIIMKDINRWDPTCYINIWVVSAINSSSSGNGVIGYAYFPSAHGLSFDGIVVEAAYFGSSPANSGVITHEMGHYLGLYHTFQGGCTNNNCLVDGDHVCDTPPDQTTFASCNPNANSCSTDADDTSPNNPFTSDVPDLGEDYMDYSSLSCFSLFTLGQSDRMNWHITNVRSSLLGCLSCQQPCPAPLAANIVSPFGPQVVPVGSTLSFFGSSVNAADEQWNVGNDPVFAQGPSASYTFNTVGVFWVKYRAVSGDPDFCLDRVDSIKVEVFCNAQAVFSVPPLVQAGFPATFLNNSVNASSYEWVLDNISISSSTDLSYTFANSGVYQLCLQATNANCLNTLCATVYVQPAGGPQAGCDNTFIKSLSNMGGTRPNIFPHPNGDFFATGLRNDSIVIVRFDQGGNALWARAFRFASDVRQIRDLAIDGSGDLIAVASPEAFSLSDLKTTVFRFNLTSNTFVWVRNIDETLYTQLHVLNTGFCVLTGESNTGATQLLRINTSTGATSGYSLEGEDGDFYSAVYNGTIYGACRRYYNAGGDFRASVFAHDLNTGNFLWQKSIISEGNTSGPNETRMYPEKPVVDGNSLVVLAAGDLVGFGGYLFGSSELVLAKTSLTGNVQWTRQYVISGSITPAATAVAATATGYYVVANLYDANIGSFSYGVLIKTDKSGIVQWAKRMGISGKNIVRNIMERNGYLYMTMSSDSYLPNDLLLIKVDENGNTNTSCEFIQPVQVETITLPNVQNVRNYDVQNFAVSNDILTSKAGLTTLETVTYCNTPCECPDMPVSAGNDVTICRGASVQLNATAGFDGYVWAPATGLDDPNSASPNAAPSATTTYTVTATKSGTQLVTNGDFSQGSFGFTTEYTQGGIGTGRYYITDNPTQFNGQWHIPLDHSPNFDNLMMMVDGNDNSTPILQLWSQNVAVQPNTDYKFEFWAAMAYPEYPPNLQIQVNGSPIGTFQLLGGTSVVGGWQHYSTTISSGSNTLLSIELYDLTPVYLGNDFAIDDISLTQTCTYTDEVTITVNASGQTLDLGPDRASCDNAVNAFDAGAGFTSYRWQDGSTDQIFTAFFPGTYWVTVRDSCGTEQTDTVHVTLLPAPTLDLGPDLAICPNNNVQLSFTSSGVFTTFNWSPATGLSCNNCASPIASPVVTTTYTLVATTADGCTNKDSVTISLLPNLFHQVALQSCANEPFVFDGVVFFQDTVFSRNYSTASGCDSLVEYTLTFTPLPTRAQTVEFCAGRSVTIDGVVYTESGTVVETIPGAPGCDTIVTYTLVKLPLLTRAQTVEFCSGKSVVIGGISYSESGTVIDTVPGLTGCDTVVTYTLVKLPLVERSETIEFCPGESVVLGGNTYTTPGSVTLTHPSTGAGCDTLVHYTLQYLTPAPSTVQITCPPNISKAVLPGTTPMVIEYNLPTTASDCPCPGIDLQLTTGIPSGGLFPSGNTVVCYTATDSCGQSASCCFTVFIREELACDVKVNGCIKYELLNITADAHQNLTYRIRVTNNCSNKLIYTAIQVPDGMTADEPDHLSIYDAPSGRQYIVANPNFSPFYSIRFKSLADSISGGDSEIFRYTLPPHGKPTYIDITSRLAYQVFYEAHLNTFNCPIGVTPPEKPGNKASNAAAMPESLIVFPNPTAGELYLATDNWKGNLAKIHLTDALGRPVWQSEFQAYDNNALHFSLPQTLSEGWYGVELYNEMGERRVGRVLLVR